MSSVEQNEGQYHTTAVSHHALQVALQTLRERCQIFQKRLVTLEEENLALRATQARIPSATGQSQYRESKIGSAGQTEVELLRESVSELTRQKTQLADHISMVAAENRQLWRRLSQIAKDVPSSFADADGDGSSGFINGIMHGIRATPRDKQQRASASNSQPGQNLIRSRTFTKNASNPKLRERCDVSSDEELLNLEDVSLLNTCGFHETVGGELLQLSLLAKQDEELLQAALEANPDIRRCTEGLSDIRNEILEQEKTLRNIFNGIKLNKGRLCHQCQNRQSSNEAKKLMKDVTVEVAESELLPLNEHTRKTKGVTCTSDTSQTTVERDESSHTPSIADSKGGMQMDLLLQEKAHANCGLDKICPMCGKPYGQDTVFDEFQQHVESHFLGDSEMDELSLDRTYEYLSQTVGNF